MYSAYCIYIVIILYMDTKGELAFLQLATLKMETSLQQTQTCPQRQSTLSKFKMYELPSASSTSALS